MKRAGCGTVLQSQCFLKEQNRYTLESSKFKWDTLTINKNEKSWKTCNCNLWPPQAALCIHVHLLIPYSYTSDPYMAICMHLTHTQNMPPNHPQMSFILLNELTFSCWIVLIVTLAICSCLKLMDRRLCVLDECLGYSDKMCLCTVTYAFLPSLITFKTFPVSRM